MTEDIQLAFQLLFVGMISVFVILSIVVTLGKLLILTVNKYSPEPVKPAVNKRKSQVLSNKELAVLTAVVDNITGGRGVIKSIQKNA